MSKAHAFVLAGSASTALFTHFVLPLLGIAIHLCYLRFMIGSLKDLTPRH